MNRPIITSGTRLLVAHDSPSLVWSLGLASAEAPRQAMAGGSFAVLLGAWLSASGFWAFTVLLVRVKTKGEEEKDKGVFLVC